MTESAKKNSESSKVNRGGACWSIGRESWTSGPNYKVPPHVDFDIAPTLGTEGSNGILRTKDENGNEPSDDNRVRKLTPLECTRLQGFPDGWLDIGEWTDTNGKVHKDGDTVKFKSLGNSIALPFWEWMAKRMVDVLKREGIGNPTMASLFDGISGFPLVFARCGCKPVWTSEIEEFPIAVCKYHFGDEDNGTEGDIEKYLRLEPNYVAGEDGPEQ